MDLHQIEPVCSKTVPAAKEEGWWYDEYGYHEHNPPHHPTNSEDEDERSKMGSHEDPTYCNTYMTRKGLRHGPSRNMDSCSPLPVGSSSAGDYKF